jgi:hypothetical protein
MIGHLCTLNAVFLIVVLLFLLHYKLLYYHRQKERTHGKFQPPGLQAFGKFPFAILKRVQFLNTLKDFGCNNKLSFLTGK